MTADEFATMSIALLRSAVHWQTAIARRLGVDSRTVRRWLAAGETPSWVDARFAELIGMFAFRRLPPPPPRDEWLIGDSLPGPDGRRREYVAHLAPPRFVARVVAVDDDGLPEPDEQPADVLSGVVYSADSETVLCEIAWIDEPDPGQVTRLLEAAADAIERAEPD